MRIRFKLRTLLIAAVVFSALFGISSSLVMDVSKERRALEALDSEWNLTTGNSWRFIDDQKWIELFANYADDKVTGFESPPRCRWIGLVARSADPITTMKQLPALKYVTKLSIEPGKSVLFGLPIPPGIEVDEYRYLGKMKRLRELSLSYPISDDVVEVVSKANLESLDVKSKDWSQSSFDAIGKMNALTSLHVKADRFSRENLIPISNMNSLQRLTLWLNNKYVDDHSKKGENQMEVVDLSPVFEMHNLNWLSLNGHLENAQLEQLGRLAELKTLDLEYTDVDDSCLETLLSLEHRPRLQFGKLQISTSSSDALRAVGFDVIHKGLIDSVSSNCLKYGDLTYRVQTENSGIVAHMSTGSEDVMWRVWLTCAQKYNPTMERQPEFEIKDIAINGDLDELVGTTLETDHKIDPFSGGSLRVDGRYLGTEKCKIEFVSRIGNRIHIRVEFRTNRSYDRVGQIVGQVDGQIDVELDFDDVFVEVGRQGSIEKGKELLGRYFDVSDFEEPISNHNGELIFDVKKPSRRPAHSAN